MILATDTFYEKDIIRTAGVLFGDWSDGNPLSIDIEEQVARAAQYQSGSFYLRELPHILRLLKVLSSPPSTVVIDGYVWLDEAGRKGLGAHLFDALNGGTPVIGVAKNPFAGSPHVIAIRRGASKRPLFITAAGISSENAADNIRRMDGKHRLPSLLKLADRLARETL